MAKVKSVKKIGNMPVYNMTVDEFHNYMIKGNVIVKNCDSLRYFCVWWTHSAKIPKKHTRRSLPIDIQEDIRNAKGADREFLLKKYGVT